MGPPNSQSLPPNLTKGSQRDTPEQNRQRLVEKTSLELLLESTERTSPLTDTQQFGLLRDSLVFNHERILQQSPPFGPSQHQDLPARPATQPHFPSLNPINSRANNYVEPTTPLLSANSEEQIIPKLYSVSDRTAQNRANANLDRHVGWQLQSQQIALGLRGNGGGNDFRTQLPYDPSGDIPLSNTVASLHLPSPPTSEMFQASAEAERPTSGTTVTTVYQYKCNRPGRQENVMPFTQTFQEERSIYEETVQEAPYPYERGVLRHNSTLDQVTATTDIRASDEEMEVEVDRQEDNNSGHDLGLKLNSTDLQTPVIPSAGDHATGNTTIFRVPYISSSF